MSIFVTSDLHFNHEGILGFERTEFATIEEHNQYIIDQYNSLVKPEDTCYILGDVGFYQPSSIKKLVQKLNGHKIYVKGNHDHFSLREALDMGFEQVYDHPIYFNDRIILSHEPVKEAYLNPYVINVHGHIHANAINLENYYNVNVSVRHYKPVNMDYFIRASQKCKFRQERFGHEWYYDFYEVKKIK